MTTFRITSDTTYQMHSLLLLIFRTTEQMQTVIEYGKKYGFMKSYPLIFVKNYSAQVLKANMKIVGATEYAVVLYRDKLPKFNLWVTWN